MLPISKPKIIQMSVKQTLQDLRRFDLTLNLTQTSHYTKQSCLIAVITALTA